MDEKEIKNGDVYGKLDFDSDEKVVLPQEVTMVKIDGRDVELPVEDLNAAGWRKVNDDETVVKKAELSEEEAKFVEENKYLPLFNPEPQDADFLSNANTYADVHTVSYMDECMMATRLIQAYFNGYTVKKEPRYYIEFPDWFDLDCQNYLAVYPDDFWELSDTTGGTGKKQFTLSELNELQKDDRAKGLDLNALKVKVPDNELAD